MTMSQNSKPSRTQPIISSYFQASPSPKKNLGKRNNDPIDLTSDGEQETYNPPAKRLKTTGSAPLADPQAVPGPSKADAWRYSPTQTQQASGAPRSPVAQKKHDAFKRVLLQENHSLSHKRRETIEEHISDEDDKSDSDEDELGNESDPFEALNALASLSKSKGKGKRKVITTTKSVEPSKTRKRPAVLGPSGRSYTDLELQVSLLAAFCQFTLTHNHPLQILKLKEDNPGTILMIEVGYKYRFFGEDAKVSAVLATFQSGDTH
jgi:DNA mismatch repair protein MSH3